MSGQAGGDLLWVPTGPRAVRPSGKSRPPPGRGGRALGCPMTGDSARCPGTACERPHGPSMAILGLP